MRPGGPGLAAALLLLAGCSYGPVRDQSRFVRVELLEDGRTVVFTFHKLRYRPASGINAFPDGGIPKYIEDATGIGILELGANEPRVVHREKNTDFVPGQGSFHIVLTGGAKVLLSQSGQDLPEHKAGGYRLETRHFLLDTRTGELQRIELEQELRKRGRAVGPIRGLLPDGTLVLVCPSLEEASEHSNWQREESVHPEIWLRTERGEWLRAGASRHYQGVVDGEIVWWTPEDRLFRSFDPATRETRILGTRTPQIDPPPSPVEGVNIGDSGRTLQYGVRRQGSWSYQPLPVHLDEL